jgi:EAL domain-containing protein (putative c-di-GMP-specific phosphodiesterase class I)
MIIEAIISLAHRLELNVCAEGVETAQQMDFLAEQGVHQLQGYYFSKPCPLDDMANCIMDLHRSRRLAIH